MTTETKQAKVKKLELWVVERFWGGSWIIYRPLSTRARAVSYIERMPRARWDEFRVTCYRPAKVTERYFGPEKQANG